jgi:pilus assembly protein Flp/PilA
MSQITSACKRFLADESGATMVEYALMVALVAIATISAVTGVATALQSQFGSAATAVGTAG